ncbi:MAG: hypothetical protein CVT66_00540 [Actinobacteria bacterium HGW-Actinobacteria-6]|nr:MAG: hypothetical protein CVT66_00540 [Actinobacteria bacterium HGW-Actinobacteria-6]
MSTVAEKIQAFLNDLAIDVIEERVVEYVIREVQNGRKLSEALHDPYVKNRLSDEKLARVLENPEVSAALEAQIAQSFKKREFGFTE